MTTLSSQTEKSDIYSLGIIMWMLSSGVRSYHDNFILGSMIDKYEDESWVLDFAVLFMTYYSIMNNWEVDVSQQ